MQSISIGKVQMPLNDFVVSRNAILGITKSGKTYTAKGVAEQLLDAKIPIIVFDAIGVWRYLKTAGDSPDAKGYKIVVAGGEAPDLPLTPASAEAIVRAAMKENIPLVIDLYDAKLSKADWRRIVQKCFRVLLYENKGLRHVFLEESAEFAPQKVMDGETYAEVEKLARMGGNKGIGITFINQRAQELNKAVLELCDNVILLRQRGSHAIDSLEKWIDRLDPDTSKAIAKSMPHMTQGDCWIFTETATEPVRTRSGLIRSLHPDRRMPEQALAGRKQVDAESFVSQLSADLGKMLEEQKANSPDELKRRIAELERQLKTAGKGTVEKLNIPALDARERKRLTTLIDLLSKIESSHVAMGDRLKDLGTAISGTRGEVQFFKSLLEERLKPTPTVQPFRMAQHPRPMIEKWKPALGPTPIQFSPNRAQQRILNAIAWWNSVGIELPSNIQIGAVALVDATGGHFSNLIGPLSTNALVERGNGCTRLTDVGRKFAVVPDAIGTLADYHAMLRERVRKSRSAGGKTVEILDAIIRAGGADITTESIGAMVNMDHTGGHFSNMIGPLGTLGLIERNRGTVKPTAILFPEGLA